MTPDAADALRAACQAAANTAGALHSIPAEPIIRMPRLGCGIVWSEIAAEINRDQADHEQEIQP